MTNVKSLTYTIEKNVGLILDRPKHGRDVTQGRIERNSSKMSDKERADPRQQGSTNVTYPTFFPHHCTLQISPIFKREIPNWTNDTADH